MAVRPREGGAYLQVCAGGGAELRDGLLGQGVAPSDGDAPQMPATLADTVDTIIADVCIRQIYFL